MGMRTLGCGGIRRGFKNKLSGGRILDCEGVNRGMGVVCVTGVDGRSFLCHIGIGTGVSSSLSNGIRLGLPRSRLWRRRRMLKNARPRRTSRNMLPMTPPTMGPIGASAASYAWSEDGVWVRFALPCTAAEGVVLESDGLIEATSSGGSPDANTWK